MTLIVARSSQVAALAFASLPLVGEASDHIGYFAIFAAQLAAVLIAVVNRRADQRREDRREQNSDARHQRDRQEAAADALRTRQAIDARAGTILKSVDANTSITERTLDTLEKNQPRAD